MQFFIRRLGAAFSALVLIAGLGSFACAADSGASFPPLEQWKSAVVAGNTALLKSMYSSNPPARIATITGASSSPDVEASFWTGLKARQIKLDVTQSTSPQPGVQQVVFEVEVHSGTAAKDHVVWVTEGQLWQEQNGSWKILATKRGDPAKLQQPLSTDKVIYAPGIDAHEEIKQAVAQAAKQHKNVLIVFGANWCYDCHVLDLAFHRADFAATMAGYDVVHIDIGTDGKKNADLAKQFQVPLEKGVPALAVIDSDGKLVVSQKNGEFENARAMTPQALLVFLNKWKPEAR